MLTNKIYPIAAVGYVFRQGEDPVAERVDVVHHVAAQGDTHLPVGYISAGSLRTVAGDGVDKLICIKM